MKKIDVPDSFMINYIKEEYSNDMSSNDDDILTSKNDALTLRYTELGLGCLSTILSVWLLVYALNHYRYYKKTLPIIYCLVLCSIAIATVSFFV